MKFMKQLIGIAIALLASVAQATPITSFEAGSLAGNGLTLIQGAPSRATIETSVVSGTTTFTPTDGSRFLKMIAGTSVDIINPLFPNELTTLVGFDNPVSIDKSILLFDIAFDNKDLSRNDRQGIGLNGIIYDLTGSSETGYTSPGTLGWQTVALSFASLGSIDLSLSCMNYALNAGSSSCFWDNFRTADSIPVPELNGIPVITPVQEIVLAPVPEPSTYALLIAGLALLTIADRRRKLATIRH
ncbi:MAG: PEP-CTERM sorting domain-containing protein [Candidatus Moranbacteria bacterium]|nr:PEP-CTERM sorting domain-containing protein [Candidatus Moranbacteria bacterium]